MLKPVAAFANCLWSASNLPSWLGFRRALTRPGETQRELLRQCLARNADCAYGRAHDFASIRTYEEFVGRVPLIEYGEIEPWIDRIRRGEQRVLTTEPVSHLIPTSGSTGGRKLIPFTAGLQRQFNRAIGPWIADLTKQHPGILGGPAYWSITPPAQMSAPEKSSVPIGFADDTEYLGGIKSWLVRQAIAAPKSVTRTLLSAHSATVEEFQYATLACLLKERELRLISVWHPSFLTLLLEALPAHWDRLVAEIHENDQRRASELERADPRQPETLWPRLRVISCWGDGAAAVALRGLRRQFPNVFVQPKGLLATEAFVTIPFQGAHLAALRSHFFEFIDEKGRCHPVDDLRETETYEVVATTAGGLWRYRLRDCVQVASFVGPTPSLRFLGRSGNVSDLFGEKLSEAFVTKAIEETLAACGASPRFALLAPDGRRARSVGISAGRYTLYLEGAHSPGVAETLDAALRENPHYACCRDLGQLLPVRVFVIREGGYETFVKRHTAQGRRLGDIKPTLFSRLAGWSELFSGQYEVPLSKDLSHAFKGGEE